MIYSSPNNNYPLLHAIHKSIKYITSPLQINIHAKYNSLCTFPKLKNSLKNHVKTCKNSKKLYTYRKILPPTNFKGSDLMQIEHNLYTWKLKCCQNICNKNWGATGKTWRTHWELGGTCWEPNGNVVRSIANVVVFLWVWKIRLTIIHHGHPNSSEIPYPTQWPVPGICHDA
jgi:hypothetical protein